MVGIDTIQNAPLTQMELSFDIIRQQVASKSNTLFGVKVPTSISSSKSSTFLLLYRMSRTPNSRHMFFVRATWVEWF